LTSTYWLQTINGKRKDMRNQVSSKLTFCPCLLFIFKLIPIQIMITTYTILGVKRNAKSLQTICRIVFSNWDEMFIHCVKSFDLYPVSQQKKMAQWNLFD
jgi:hypothetical protein